MNSRVNGVLAVTRSLGDSAMKEFVVGSPYTTETVLGSEDDFLIIACDGVSFPLFLALVRVENVTLTFAALYLTFNTAVGRH